MATQGKWEGYALAAGEDLDDAAAGTGDLFKAIALDDGRPAANGKEAGGLLQYGGKNAEHITIAYFGVSKYVANDAITPGVRLSVVASGYCSAAGSGDHIVGRNGAFAVASGAIGEGLFNFAMPHYLGSSES